LRTEGQSVTDMTTVRVAFRSFTNLAANYLSFSMCVKCVKLNFSH